MGERGYVYLAVVEKAGWWTALALFWALTVRRY
jgi:hypothetical protein